MEILRCSTVLLNYRCDLQQEDWSETYPSIYKQGDQLAAYPKAMVSGNSGGRRFVKGEPFRLGMHFPSVEAANSAFDALEQGAAKLQDYVAFFDTIPGEKQEDILMYL